MGPIINNGATTGYKKQLSAASCNWKMDEQWSMEHGSTVHPFSSRAMLHCSREQWSIIHIFFEQ